MTMMMATITTTTTTNLGCSKSMHSDYVTYFKQFPTINNGDRKQSNINMFRFTITTTTSQDTHDICTFAHLHI